MEETANISRQAAVN